MATYVPNIPDYQPFYIQRASDLTAIDIMTTYAVIVKDSGYPMQRKAKEPYKNDWKDKNGDDEWNASLQYEAFTYTFTCAIFARNSSTEAACQDLKNAVRAFQNAIKDGEWKFFSSYHKFGFQKVRVEEFHDPGDEGFSTYGETARVIFNFTVKVNDPMTDMKLSSGSIVSA